MKEGAAPAWSRGLTTREAAARLAAEGPNLLPRSETLFRIVGEVLRGPRFALRLGADALRRRYLGHVLLSGAATTPLSGRTPLAAATRDPCDCLDLDQCTGAVFRHHSNMERMELLRARIALYRRYLREGADGDLAAAYLWLIRKDEIELTALGENFEREPDARQKNPDLRQLLKRKRTGAN